MRGTARSESILSKDLFFSPEILVKSHGFYDFLMKHLKEHEDSMGATMQNIHVLQSIFLESDTSSVIFLSNGRLAFGGMVEVFLLPQAGAIFTTDKINQMAQELEELYRCEFEFQINPNGEIEVKILSPHLSQDAISLFLNTIQEMNQQKTLAPLLPGKFDHLYILGQDIRDLCLWVHNSFRNALGLS